MLVWPIYVPIIYGIRGFMLVKPMINQPYVDSLCHLLIDGYWWWVCVKFGMVYYCFTNMMVVCHVIKRSDINKHGGIMGEMRISNEYLISGWWLNLIMTSHRDVIDMVVWWYSARWVAWVRWEGATFLVIRSNLGLMGWGLIRDYLEDMTGYKD